MQSLFFKMRILSLLVFFLASSTSFAQEISNFTQFYVNPYLINPSFAGIEGKTGMYMTYRSQWTDFEGAPEIGNLTFHSAINKSMGLGINLNNDRRSILNTSSAMASFAYSAMFTNTVFLRFGISAGAASNGVDFDMVGEADPALLTSLENNMFLIGNAGLSLHAGTFHLGVSMPDMFRPLLFSDQEFGYELQPAERFIVSASNRFYFGGDKHIFEPFVLYRYHQALPPQLEAAAILHLNHALWFGGSYKQDFGISATAGFKLPELFGIGYSYTFDNVGINKIASPTHEVSISLLLGKRKERSQKYSFISTIIEEMEPEPEEEEPIEEEVAKVEEPEEEEPEEEIVEEEVEEPVDTEEVETGPVTDPGPDSDNGIDQRPENDERVAVKKGSHLLELNIGEYVVVGVFSTFDNAEEYSDELFQMGYHGAQFGYISEKGYWYVFIHKTDDPVESRRVRDEMRKIPLFKDAWVLGVEE